MKKILTILLAIGIMLTSATSVFADDNQLDRIEDNTKSVLNLLNAVPHGLRNGYSGLTEYQLDYIYNNYDNLVMVYLANVINYSGDLWFNNNDYEILENSILCHGMIGIGPDNTNKKYINDIEIEKGNNDNYLVLLKTPNNGYYELKPYKLNIETNLNINNNCNEPYKSSNIYYETKSCDFNIVNPNKSHIYSWYLDDKFVQQGDSYTYTQDKSEHKLSVYENYNYDNSIINNSINEGKLPSKILETQIYQSVYDKNLNPSRINILGTHNAYVPDLQEIYDKLGHNFTAEDVSKYFYDSDTPVDKIVWLRSGVDGMPDCGLCINCLTGKVEIRELPAAPIEAKPVFNIDLKQINFE